MTLQEKTVAYQRFFRRLTTKNKYYRVKLYSYSIQIFLTHRRIINELLQKLLEAEILSEDTKKELEEALKNQLDEAVAAAKENAAADVRAELTEQWIQEKDTLIEAIDTKVGEYLEQEIEELKEDIDRFRDLEAEYAEKLVEAKAAMADELQADLTELVEKIDSFLEIRLSAEIDELREDIEVVRENEFGRKIYEAFAEEFMKEYADDESAELTLREAEERLADTEQALEEAERRLATMERKDKMAKVLSPLRGKQREVMEAILKNVDTEALEEGYNTFIGRVLSKTSVTEDAADSEKEDKVLAESEVKKEKPVTEGVIKTGDKEEVLEEGAPVKTETDRLAHLRRLAGIING